MRISMSRMAAFVPIATAATAAAAAVVGAVMTLALGVIMPARAEAQIGISINASTTLTSGDDSAYDRNRMNRSDNPFSPARVLFLAGGKLNESTSLFIEVPYDVQSRESTFFTYVRPFVRIENIAGQGWLNTQTGKLATPWGTYGERSASPKNAVIGLPLLYYYRTALRPGFVFSDAAEFMANVTRGQGHTFARDGETSSFRGSPLIYEACWNLGTEVYGSTHGVQYSAAALMGTLSEPAPNENYNDGYGLSGRLGYLVQDGPLFGLRVGISGGAGPYLASDITEDPDFPAGKSAEDYWNTALGADLSYARGPWNLIAEAGNIGYEVPNLSETLSAFSYYVELERKIGPRWSVGVRRDGIVFNEIQVNGYGQKWDWDVNRWETAISYRFQPGSRIRAGYQATLFPGHGDLDEHLFALQLQVWTR